MEAVIKNILGKNNQIMNLEYMEPKFMEIILLAHKKPDQIIEDDEIKMATVVIKHFCRYEILDINDAKCISSKLLEKYFESSPVEAKANFVTLICNYQQSCENPSQDDISSLTPISSLSSLTLNFKNNATVAPSFLCYSKDKPTPKIVLLFNTSELRELHGRIADYLHGKIALKNDRRTAAKVVFEDLVRFARAQAINFGVEGWRKLKIPPENYEVAASALIIQFPCTATEIIHGTEKPADVYYQYDEKITHSQAGLLYTELQDRQEAEANQERRSKVVLTNVQGRQTLKKFKATHSQAKKVENKNNDDPAQDPLRNTGMQTNRENRNQFLELYYTELVVNNRAKTEKTCCKNVTAFSVTENHW